MGNDKTTPSADTIGKGIPVRDPSAARTPGRVAREPRVRTGDDYIDHGAVCDGAPTSATCFLEETQRSELIDRLQLDMANAGVNYKLALEAVRVDVLLKKVTEDVGIIGGIVIDLVKDFAIDKLGHTLGRLQKLGMAALDSTPGAGEYGPVRTNKGQDLFAKLTDARITAAIKKIADPAKKAFSSSIGENAERSAEKAADLTLIKQLTQNTNRMFQMLSSGIPAVANDAELVWLWMAFKDTDAHAQDAYETALRAKIARFQKSGVDKIGRRKEPGTLDGISRLTRVCVIHFTSGHAPEHWLEVWDQRRDKFRQTERSNAEERGQVDGIGFSQPNPETPGPGLLRRIPDEFVEIALQRQEQVFADRSMGVRVIDESERPGQYSPERVAKARKKSQPEPAGDPLGFAPTPANAAPSAPSSVPMIPTQPTSFGGADQAPIVPPTGPLGFGDS